MKLKRLTITNIASIAQADIDFECQELANESLFLISGETGAGKSTILDCLCLTLYDSTPRLALSPSRENYTLAEANSTDSGDSLSVNDTRQLLRRGEGEGETTLTFTGNDDNDYQARWSVRRARGKANGRLQSSKWAITCITTGVTTEHKSENQDIIARAVGMTATQFYRTVILPQGQFDRFLKSKGDDKSEILEKLTGTAIYSQVGQRIYETTRSKQAAVDRQQLALEGITLLTGQERQDIDARLADNRNRLALLETRRKEVHEAIAVIEELEAAKRKKADIDAKLLDLRHTIDSPQMADEKLLVQQWYQSADARAALSITRKAQEQCGRLERQRVAMREKTRQLLAGYRYLQSRLAHLQEKQQQSGNPETIQAELEGLNKQYAGLDVAATQRQKDELGKETLALTAARHAVDSLDQSQNRTREARERLEKSRQAEQDRLQTMPPLETALQLATEEHRQAKDNYDRQRLSIQQWAKEARGMLRQGDHCPVCGKVVEQIIDDAPFEQATAPAKKAADDAYAKLIDAQAALQAAREEAKNLSSTTQDDARQALRAEDDCKKQRQAAVIALEKCGLTLVDDVTDTIAERQRKIAQQDDMLTQRLTQANELHNCIRAVQRQMDQARETQNEVIQATRELSSAENPKEKMRQFIDDEAMTIPEPVEVQDLSSRWNSLAQEHAEWNAALDSQREIAATHQKTIDDYRLASGMDQATLETLEQTPQAAIEAIKERHDRLAADAERLAGQQLATGRELEETLKKRTALGQVTLQELQQQYDEAQAAIDQINQNQGALDQKLLADRQNAERAGELHQQIQALKNEAAEWEALNSLLGSHDGKKFRNIAQSFILNDLLNHANYFLSRFNDRYLLTCEPVSLTILVQDLQCGNRVSSVNSLSGGESFMVSLALALALARMTGQVFAVDTLFIDEGFGSLSPAHLDKVMDTLERLHALGGRRVGIISHVESLKERVPVQIVVERDSCDNTRSTVSIKR